MMDLEAQVCPLQLKEPSTKHNTTHTVWAPWVYCFLLPSYFLFSFTFCFCVVLFFVLCLLITIFNYPFPRPFSCQYPFVFSVPFSVLFLFLFILSFGLFLLFYLFLFPSFLHSICWRKHEHIRFGGHYKLHYPWYSGHFQTYQILQSSIFTQTPYGSQRYSRYWKFQRRQCWRALDPKRGWFHTCIGEEGHNLPLIKTHPKLNATQYTVLVCSSCQFLYTLRYII